MKIGAMTRPFGVALFALSGMAIAFADELTVSGNTNGGFNANPTGATADLLGLHYSGSTFSETTVGGFLSFGGDPNPGSNFNNFGSFTLDPDQHTYNGNTFTLEVTFTAPPGISGGNQATFTANLIGAVSSTATGGVFVDFDNTPQSFTFANALTFGSFSLWVNDVSVAPGQTVGVSANVLGSQEVVPEPASLAALGLGALGLMRRRRRK